jgi:hypothetical protein
MSDAHDLLTPAELAARLQISSRQYFRLLAQGLPYRLVGTEAKRFVWTDVLAWLPRRAVPGRVGLIARRPDEASLLGHLKRLARAGRAVHR